MSTDSSGTISFEGPVETEDWMQTIVTIQFQYTNEKGEVEPLPGVEPITNVTIAQTFTSVNLINTIRAHTVMEELNNLYGLLIPMNISRIWTKYGVNFGHNLPWPTGNGQRMWDEDDAKEYLMRAERLQRPRLVRHMGHRQYVLDESEDPPAIHVLMDQNVVLESIGNVSQVPESMELD